MQKYIGVKFIEAKPMTSTEASMYLGRHIPDSEREREGYLVVYENGYRSWSPKLTFEGAYRPIDGLLTFGLALEAVKKGYKIARKGWNDKGMFVEYQKGYPQGIPSNAQTAKARGINEGDLFRCEPYLQIKITNSSYSIWAMWTPTINDCLAEDWYIVED